MHARGERANLEEVVVDAGGGRRRRFAAVQRADRERRSLSIKRKVAMGGLTARGVCRRRGSSLQEDQRFVNFFVVKLWEP